MMVTLHVKCGICGHEAVVTFHQRQVPGRRNPVPIIPQLWICDNHHTEYICTAEEEYDPDEV